MAEKRDPRQVVTFRGRLVTGLLTMVVLGVGCSKGQGWWDASRLATTNLVLEDAITVIVYTEGEKSYSRGMEEGVVECIKGALEDTHPTVRVVPPDEFRRVAFPDLAPEQILPADRSWENMVRDPTFQQRIAHLGLHYLIAVSGWTQLGPLKPGAGGAGMLPAVGLARGIKESFLYANIMDLKRGNVTGRVQAEATGKGGGGLILPIPLYVPPSDTEGRVCSELGKGVAKFLAGGPRERFTFPWLGVTLEAEGGILTVEKVHQNSLAEGARLESGDWLLRYQGKLLQDRASLEEAVCTPTVSEFVILTLRRSDQRMDKGFRSGDFGCPNPTVSAAPQ